MEKTLLFFDKKTCRQQKKKKVNKKSLTWCKYLPLKNVSIKSVNVSVTSLKNEKESSYERDLMVLSEKLRNLKRKKLFKFK